MNKIILIWKDIIILIYNQRKFKSKRNIFLLGLGEDFIKIYRNTNFDEKQKNKRINIFDSQKNDFSKWNKKSKVNIQANN